MTRLRLVFQVARYDFTGEDVAKRRLAVIQALSPGIGVNEASQIAVEAIELRSLIRMVVEQTPTVQS